MARIDAHQHFWDPARGDYGWMDTLEAKQQKTLKRVYLPEDLQANLDQHRITKTVVVQAAATEAEGNFLLSLADKYDCIGKVVVWIDMEAEDFTQRLEHFAKHPKFAGIRPMIQDIEDEKWMLRESVLRSFAALEKQEICFDFLTKPNHLQYALQILKQFPNLRCVIDHISKPDIANGTLEPWQDEIMHVAECSNIYCKLSGMITEANHDNWTEEDLYPYIATIVDAFGAERLMFGSDWPVCLLAGSYDQVVQALEVNLEEVGVSLEEKDWIFGEVAKKFYKIT